MIRLYLEEFGSNSDMSLSAEHSHYLCSVMRKNTGDVIALFNNTQGEWIAEITRIDKKKSAVHLLRQSKKPNKTLKFSLIFAPAKTNYPTVIQKATELGVTDIHPVITERSVVKDFNYERMYKIAIEASEQSERLSVPKIHEFRKIDAFEFEIFANILLCDETRDGKPMPIVLENFQDGNNAIIIGAEGGFAEHELTMMKQLKNCYPVKLSNNILKSDTAAIAALSIYKAVFCD